MKGFIFLFILIGVCPMANCQITDPVVWSFSAERAGEDQYKAIFKADIRKGWAIYAGDTDPGGPVPTKFEFEANENIILINDVIEPEEKEASFDDLFEVMVTKIKDSAEFYQMINCSSRGTVLKGTITYMSCDDVQCLPPRTISFSIPMN